MTFPKNKQQFVNLIKQTNFKIKDIGNYSFKILNNFEKGYFYLRKSMKKVDLNKKYNYPKK